MMKTKPRGEMSHPAPTAHLSESLTPEQGLGLGPGVWCVICTVFSSHICIFRNSSAEWIPFSVSQLQKVGCVLPGVWPLISSWFCLGAWTAGATDVLGGDKARRREPLRE